MYQVLLDNSAIILEPSSGPAATQPAIETGGFINLIHTTPTPYLVASIAIAVLIFGWFGMRYWLAITKPGALKEVATPTINRLNASALAHMADESAEEAEEELAAKQHEQAPDDLLAAVPPEEVEVQQQKPDGKKA